MIGRGIMRIFNISNRFFIIYEIIWVNSLNIGIVYTFFDSGSRGACRYEMILLDGLVGF